LVHYYYNQFVHQSTKWGGKYGYELAPKEMW
jgi:hypothetical protein